MNNLIYFKKILNESITELSSDYSSFDEFKRDSSNHFFVYHTTNKNAVDNILINGSDGAKEFFTTMAYGRGIYTVLDDLNARRNTSYGNCVVKFLVRKGAFNNFLIFDKDIKKRLQNCGALTLHERISETMKRLLSEEQVRKVERYIGNSLTIFDEMFMSDKYSSHYIEGTFLNAIRSGEGEITLRKGYRYYSELDLDKSKVDGFMYEDSHGKVAIFRRTDLLIPYSWFYNNEPEDAHYCITSNSQFDRLNNVADIFRHARREYPDTNFTTKTVCGFGLTKKGNKYNLLNAKTYKYFSPLDFDSCDDFDPVSEECSFTINDDDGTPVHFKIISKNYGNNIKMYYLDENEWSEISYKDFIEFANEIKKERLVSESVKEVFTHKTFDEFKKSLNNNRNIVYLYRASSPEVAKSEYENGPNIEFPGTGGDDSLYYGFGLYTVRDLNSLLGSKYGKGICKFVLKDGYKDFIILDDEVRAKYDPGATVYDELVRLVPKDILDDINRKLKNGILGNHLPRLNSHIVNGALNDKGIDAFKNTKIDWCSYQDRYITASFARALKLLFQGEKLNDKYARHAYNELLLAKTRIRGFVYTGASDGRCCLVRDFNSVMPVAYSIDGGMTWINDKDNESHFDEINKHVHPWYLYKGEYNKVKLRDKQSCGFSLVSGEQGYNYKDIWFHRYLLPIDVDTAEVFDENSKKAQFIFAGITFEITLIGENEISLIYYDDGASFPTNYEEFMSLIEACKEQGIIDANKKIYANSLLKDLKNINN